jgi:Photosynthetic reaction centre cytochrome C subunit
MVSISVAAIQPDKNKSGEFKNLKVLPQDISSKDLNKIMVDEFQDDLGISCNFCHAENKETHKPDYTSDAKPEKEIARAMMKMTIGINQQYFGIEHPMIGDSSLAITCATCHHGQPHPGTAGEEIEK